ncbi:MAG: dTDP-4-dehydrorhamnose reductase [Actinomycetaceae bacterium]|nr:dTDP-4-dehydrorhamnose reductase [Actinomycetaceae bacterium]
MRWVLVGANGMLGQDLAALLKDRGQEVTTVDLPEIDITDRVSVERNIAGGTDIVVNCAAFTAVDKAEEAEALAFTINAVGPQYLAQRCKDIGARLVHISTDYVFDGAATEPYKADAPICPASAYGRTKGAGEWAIRSNADNYLIVRTAWLYGQYGNCFPKTMARLAGEHDSLKVVGDQFGQPTWTVDLSDLIYRLVEGRAPSGIYHGTSQGKTSWHGFTQAIVASLGKDPSMVNACTTEEFPRPAPRPAFSVLDHGSLRAQGVEPIGDWHDRWQTAAQEVLGL